MAYQGNHLYDFDNKLLLTKYPQRVIQYASQEDSVLELGIGHGFCSEIFSKNFKRHLILEGSISIIENFQEKNPSISSEILHTYFENFDSAEKFDVIVMGFILEHVDDPVQLLKKYKKYLSPRGRIFIAVPNAASMNRRLGHMAGLLPDLEALSAYDDLLGHKRYYTVDSLKNDIAQSGFLIKKIEGIFLKPLTSRQLGTLNLSDEILDALCELGKPYPELSCSIFAELKPIQ